MPLTKVSSGVIAANAVVDSFGTQSITGDKLGLTAINANNIVNSTITGAKIATGQITGNLLTANCVSGNNIVSGLALTGNVSVTGNVTVGSTIGVGGATPSTSGAGITFPATASASSDANTLDDYEEGTYTATLTAGTTAPSTPITTTGKYIKIGKQVTVTFGFTNVDTTGASGALLVTGLPFEADGGIPEVGCPPMLYSLPSTLNYNVWYITGTTLNLYAIGNAAGWSPENISAGSGKYVWSTVTYITG
jgi:hypothetical protein